MAIATSISITTAIADYDYDCYYFPGCNVYIRMIFK